MNRGVGRMTLFDKPGDFEAFERVMVETRLRSPSVDLLAYCLMPNHWHLVLRPTRGGALSEFMRLLTVTHTQRWHAHRRSAGTGPVYQGRFKCFPVESDGYFRVATRYVERNALRAGLVKRAQDWAWSSLSARRRGKDDELRALLSPWPLPAGTAVGPLGEPADWLRTANRPQTQAELDAVRRSVVRGRPLGDSRWVERTAARLGLAQTLRPRGRPRKQRGAEKMTPDPFLTPSGQARAYRLQPVMRVVR